MKRYFSPLLHIASMIFACLAFVPTAFAQESQPPRPSSYPERTALWEKAIATFETQDKEKGMPESGGIVFVGSSSIVGWKTLTEDFPGLPVLNRGFGGSEVQDSVYYAGRIVLPYKPSVVVLYAGDNDIAAGRTLEQIVGGFQTFARKIHAALPDTKILFLAIKPSPSRWSREGQMVAVNRAIADWIAMQKNMVFIDVHTPMLGSDGLPRPELYKDDRLHMTPTGYRLWAEIVTPYLKAALPSSGGR
jgi:lysophospholipase L1-like esterase